MAVQYLLLYTSVRIPDSASLITTSSDDLIALRVELDLRYLVLVTLEKRSASTSEHIIDSCQAVGRCCREFIPCIVECSVQHLIVMALECFYTLPRGYVP